MQKKDVEQTKKKLKSAPAIQICAALSLLRISIFSSPFIFLLTPKICTKKQTKNTPAILFASQYARDGMDREYGGL